jgi:hypothetical protein
LYAPESLLFQHNIKPFTFSNALPQVWRRVNVGLFRGAEIADPDGLLEGTGKFMRHVKLGPARDVDAMALRTLIATAYADMKARISTSGTGSE